MKFHNNIILKEDLSHGNLMFPIKVYYTILGKIVEDLYLHWHEEMEFIYIKSGKGIFFIDLQQYELTEGDILIVPSQSLHSGKPNENFLCECQTIVFSMDIFKSFIPDIIQLKYINPLIEKELILPKIITKKDHIYPSIISNIINIIDLFNNSTYGFELSIKVSILQIFSTLFTHNYIIHNNMSSMNSMNKNSQKIKIIVDYIQKNYKKQISLKEISNIVGFSEHHFCRFFKLQTGQNFIDYINSIRINEASKLIVNSNLSITEIGFEVGFENLSYFNRVFKNKMKVTPSSFKKNSI